MDEQIKQLRDELESLREYVEELESRIDDQEASYSDNVSDVICAYEAAQEFSDLDEIPTYTDENVIILHKNRFRTADLARACQPSGHSIAIMYNMIAQYLTPAELLRKIANEQQGAYIFIKSNIFSISDEFEKIVADAIKEGRVFFAVFTNNLEKIPKSLRDQMRVIE